MKSKSKNVVIGLLVIICIMVGMNFFLQTGFIFLLIILITVPFAIIIVKVVMKSKKRKQNIKSIELDRSFSEIAIKARETINKKKDEINSSLTLIEKSLSTNIHVNPDLKLKIYSNARLELNKVRKKCNKDNLGPDFKQKVEEIFKIHGKIDEFYSDLIKGRIGTARNLKEQKKFDESIKKLKKTFEISENILDFKLKREWKEKIKANSDLIYSAMIKSEIETSYNLKNLKKYDEMIKKLETIIEITDNFYDLRLQKESIEEINQLIYKIRIAKIKKTILDLGMRFPRLQASDIAEECGEDEGLIVSTIKEMIVNEEIYAKYFENSQSVVFDQRGIEGEIEKFTERLDKQFEEWYKKEKGKTGKNE